MLRRSIRDGVALGLLLFPASTPAEVLSLASVHRLLPKPLRRVDRAPRSTPSTSNDQAADEPVVREGRRLPTQPAADAAPRSDASRQRETAEVFAATQLGPFDDVILLAARRWRLDPFLLKGLLANESRLDPVTFGKRRFARRNGARVIVSGGAVGIAQFTRSGIRAVNVLRRRRQRRGAPVLLFDVRRALVPEEAIPAAAELLAHLIERYGRDGGITAYNSGVIGGMAVSRLGFWRARYAGKLRKVGIYLVQGERFLLNVLKRASWYRRQVGLDPLGEADELRPDSQRYAHRRRPSVSPALPAPSDSPVGRQTARRIDTAGHHPGTTATRLLARQDAPILPVSAITHSVDPHPPVAAVALPD